MCEELELVIEAKWLLVKARNKISASYDAHTSLQDVICEIENIEAMIKEVK